MWNRPALIITFLVAFAFQARANSAKQPETATDLVYFNEGALLRVKSAIDAKDPYFFDRYTELLVASDLLLASDADPVVNKTVVPPSGDIHDYISYAPYRWPDETKEGGLPWKAIDGVVNPVSRGADTDYVRLRTFSGALETLSFAYYFSGDAKYSQKGVELLKIWFVDPDTRVNPNINYGQGVPGLAEGRPAGLIEWSRISTVITAMQIFEKGGVLPADVKTEILAWMQQYLNWLLTSQLGKEADALPQNHANWYNYQVVGLMIYLGRTQQAKAKVEDAKRSRIAAQILPDGRQPRETGRTKSMHYSTMNLWALANLTFMGRKVGVDLWEFETEDSRSLRQAYRFLEPYALGEKDWPYKQITRGGAREAIRTVLKPLFAKTSSLLGVELSGGKSDWYLHLSAIDVLRYPPEDKLP